MSQGDPFAIYVLAVIIGFDCGWIALKSVLFVAWRFFGLQLSWNNSLAILLILAAGLSAVISAVTSRVIHPTSAFAYLPAAFVGSAFTGGLAFHGSQLYLAARRQK